MTYNIKWNGGYGTEIVDTAETLQEAKTLTTEYQMAYQGRVWWERQ